LAMLLIGRINISQNNRISVFSEMEKIGFIIFSIIYHRYRE